MSDTPSVVVCKVGTTVLFGLFSGAALYVAVVEHPVKLNDVRHGVKAFKARRTILPATSFQSGVAALAGVASATAAVLTKDVDWYIPAAMSVGILGWTGALVTPVEKKLLDIEVGPEVVVERVTDVGKRDEEGRVLKGLLESWGGLHWVKTAMGVLRVTLISHS
ncbi:hypothetical protein BC829DRAFT_432111 [Chytridium lagenaria]|nr:hypothetical protein BC829DRAFT_432111 [Chytridium lagenaria]